MTDKLANKSGPIAPSIAGYLENRRIPGVFFASRRNRCRQVAEIPHGFHPAEDFPPRSQVALGNEK
jgi:hypothetical protein